MERIFSVVFERGGYDGFDPGEAAEFLKVLDEIEPSVKDYMFTNVMKLAEDHRKGYFNKGFE